MHLSRPCYQKILNYLCNLFYLASFHDWEHPGPSFCIILVGSIPLRLYFSSVQLGKMNRWTGSNFGLWLWLGLFFEKWGLHRQQFPERSKSGVGILFGFLAFSSSLECLCGCFIDSAPHIRFSFYMNSSIFEFCLLDSSGSQLWTVLPIDLAAAVDYGGRLWEVRVSNIGDP